MENSSLEKCDIFDFMANHVGLTVIHPGGLEATNTLLEACNIQKDKTYLDVGCGIGTTSVLMAQKYGCKVVGLDTSQDLLNEAAELVKRKNLQDRVSFRQGDALNLPFGDNEFDGVIGQAVLILVKDKPKAVREALRVIKPGGTIGWLEWSWKKQPTKEFLDGVSNVICADSILGVETFENWKTLFNECGVRGLQSLGYEQKISGLPGMLSDEGPQNSGKIMRRYLTSSGIRKRVQTLDKFFKQYDEFFGYGIYTGKK
jgi:SAM-dependent methyltransferase